jgi:hypothetical protein
MKPVMPMSMVQARTEILAHIASGKSDRWIARETHHGRDLIRDVRRGMKSPNELFQLKHELGAPRKVIGELIAEIELLTQQHPHLGCVALSHLLNEFPDLPNVGKSTLHTIRHQLHFSFAPPIITFPLTDLQVAARYAFAEYHITRQTDWSRVVFTGESCFVLGSGRWLWRRRGEVTDQVLQVKQKFPAKVMIFAGISHDYKSTLVAIESGSVDAVAYVDDFVDASGIILDMNQRYGVKQWTYMQDGASVHRAENTMASPNMMANVLE